MNIPYSIVLLISIYFLLRENQCHAQMNVKDTTINASMLGISFGYHSPQMDLSDRFLPNMMVGGNYMYKFSSNWIITTEANFFWRDSVKTNDILDDILNSQNLIFNKNGSMIEVLLFERGINAYLGAGKIFPLFGPNKNSGIMVTTRVGYLQHKILLRIMGTDVVSLTEEIQKGYDRFSSGISAGAFLGYLYLGNNRRSSFFIGIDFLYAKTINRRGYNYYEMSYDLKKRDDSLLGAKAGWILPLYRRVAREYYID